MLTDDLARRASRTVLGRVRHEREDTLRVRAPDDVRCRLDKPPEARLLLGETLRRFEFVRAMAAWSARPWSRSRSSASNMRGVAVEIGERADDLAAGRAQRRRGHPAQTQPLGDGLVVGLVRDARVGQVVEGPDRRALLGREAVDPRRRAGTACPSATRASRRRAAG